MKRAIRRIAILGHSDRPSVRRAAAALSQRLTRAGYSVRIESELADRIGAPPVPLHALARWCRLMI